MKRKKERYTENPRNVIVAGNPEWKPSLVGLVANICAEEFSKPVFLWGRDGDGVIKGSCRSGGTVSVVDIMHKVPSGVILQYGGHFASGGFSIADEAIHHLEEHLNSAYDLLVKDNEKDGVEIEPEYIDIELTLDDINWNFYEKIEKLADVEGIDKMSWIRRALATFVNGEEKGPYDHVSEVLFSPDSSEVVYVAEREVEGGGEPGSSTILYENVPAGQPASYTLKYFLFRNDQHSKGYNWIHSPSFSPDGKSLAYIVREGNKYSVIVNDRKGKEYDNILTKLKFSPDGKYVGYGARLGNELWWVIDEARI